MSQYKSVSIDRVIAKIIRDTRIQDTSYISDFYEWIPEAMELMHTNAPLIPDAVPVKINFHVGKLPCGLIYIKAIEYQGKRLGYYNGVRKLGAPGTVASNNPIDEAPFESKIIAATTVNGNVVIDSTLVPPTTIHSTAQYQIYLDHIATTFSDGEVLVHCERMAMDDRGLPLIPDHPDYKEAIYWFVRTKMIQAGYDDPMYHSDDRMPHSRWEQHAARAISDITYPTPDEKEAQLAMQVRFVPPTDYWSSFFNSTLGEGPIGI
jgi:predicted lipoprotein